MQVEGGANCKLRSKSGKTAKEFAVAYRKESVATYLEQQLALAAADLAASLARCGHTHPSPVR